MHRLPTSVAFLTVPGWSSCQLARRVPTTLESRGFYAHAHHCGLLLLQVQQLLKRQDSSPTGVIRLTPGQFDEFLTGKKRPYHFVFSLTADHLLDRPQLQLRELRKDFGYLAKTARRKFANTPTAGKVGLVDKAFHCKLADRPSLRGECVICTLTYW